MEVQGAKLKQAIEAARYLRIAYWGAVGVSVLVGGYGSLMALVSRQGWGALLGASMTGSLVSAVAVGFAIGMGYVLGGLRRRELWAWVTSVILFGLCVGSLLFPLGIYGLIRMLDPEVRRVYLDEDRLRAMNG